MGTRTSGSGERAGETDARKSRTALRPDPHYWAADLLQADGAEVQLVHPLGLHMDARRVKNDERDATELAHRLRRGDLPESWIAPPEVRELRELMRYRARLAALRTSAKAQIHAVMAKLGILPTMSDMFGPTGQGLLDEMPFEGAYATRVASLRGLLERYEDELVYCFADATGECLSETLRPGNAGANTITDHVEVLDQAIAGLPEEIAKGHRLGDDPGLVERRVRVRTDSAGCTNLVWDCRERNVGFSVVARSNASVHAAISRVRFDDEAWQPALTQAGEPRPAAAVAELTEFVDLTGWPPGTRLIVRREPLHQGAQGSLFPSETFRYWGHYTDSTADPVDADLDMRGHARVEDNIRRLKDSGASRFPFTDLDANRAWLDVVAFADALVRWFQLLCVPGRFATAEPKTMRWGFWHTPARLIRHARRNIVRIIDGWPTTAEILTAYQRIALLT